MTSYATEYWKAQLGAEYVVCPRCTTYVYKNPLPGSFGECGCSPSISFADLEAVVKTERDSFIKEEEDAIKRKDALHAAVASGSGWPADEKAAKTMGIATNVYREFNKTLLPALRDHSSDWDDTKLGDDEVKCAIAYSKFYESSAIAKKTLLDEWRNENVEDVITALIAHFDKHSIVV